MAFLPFRPIRTLAEWLSQATRDQFNALMLEVKKFAALHEPIVRMLARWQYWEESNAEPLIRATIEPNPVLFAPNRYRYEARIIPTWDAPNHKWIANWQNGTLLGNVYNLWEMTNTEFSVLGGVAVTQAIPPPGTPTITMQKIGNTEIVYLRLVPGVLEGGEPVYEFAQVNAITVECPEEPPPS